MGHGKRTTVLLAEAEGVPRDVLASLLAPRFDAVVTAASLAEAREAMARGEPDMAVVAARLPGGGAALAAALRQACRSMPLFLTGTAEDVLSVLTTLSLPGVRAVVRPFDPTALAEALDDAVEELGSRQSAKDAWELVRHFLDEAPQPAAILHGGRVVSINRAFLRFMGLASVQEFTAKGLSLEHFLADPPPREGLAAWACRLPDDRLDREHRLRLHHPGRPDQPAHVFQVAATRLPGRDRCLLTLADVTDLELERRELLDLANLDPLTRALNRRKLAEVMIDEAARAARYRSPLSVVLLDIDRFKAINDTHGHAAGDAVLVELAARLRGGLRQVDRLARYGGEEFVVVAPGIDGPGAYDLAERLRLAVGDKDFAGVGRVTASFGVAGHVPGEEPEAMLRRADEALYRAKNGGRNKVEREASPQHDAR
uniref:diguanylate cyclase n=1 Tax=Desulfovibrio sp. U5L TaxID=596152 RepID=I2PXK6_9BACT